MKRRLLSFVEVVSVIIFCISLYKLLAIYKGYKQGDEIYKGAQNYTETEPQKEDDEEEQNFYFVSDLAKLKSINEEVCGWILIPDTQINYPLMNDDNNQYYLKHTYDNIYSDFGSIFIDCKCSFLDFNTVIYGHNTRNGSMFGSLKEYKDLDYYKEHPSIYILYEDIEKRYDIIAALTVEVTDPAYEFNQDSNAEQKLWLEELISRSEVPTLKTTPVNGEEKIITLSTCTSRTKTERFIVIAEEVKTVWEK